MLKKLLPALWLLTTALPAAAATPSQVQSLIDQGKCDQALIELQAQSSLNPAKQSDVFNVLLIEASLCDGRIAIQEAKDYALKTLLTIEKTNPMLIGLDVNGFNKLKKTINELSVGNSTASSYGFLLWVSLILFGGIIYLSVKKLAKSDNDFDQIGRSIESKEISDKKSLLEDRINKLMIQVDDKIQKNQFMGHDDLVNKLTSMLNRLEELKSRLWKTNTLVDIKGIESSVENLSVILKIN